MNKIKVLQVIGTLHIGGAENVAMNLYRYIDRDKFEFHYLVYSSNVEGYEKEVLELGGKVIRLKRKGGNDRAFQKALCQIMKDNQYDIVHSHLMFHNAIVMKCAYKVGIKNRISHAHSTKNKLCNSYFECFLQFLYQSLSRAQIQKYATHYIACGADAGDFLYGKKLFEKKGKVLNNGINIDQFNYNPEVRKKIREKYNLSDRYVYGNAAHFIPLKNHKFLLNVFQKIKKVQDNAYLILMGDGELKEEIENEVVQMGLKESVLFTGNISNVNEILQALDMFIMPSVYEGLPLSLIESQAAGLRCVVSDSITKELDVCGLLQFLPLEKGTDYWAEKCLEYSKYDRVSTKELIRDAGYDVKKNGEDVGEWYINMLNNI